MKPKKLTSLMVMLLLALSATGQEQFFDDVYYSSDHSKEKASVEKDIKKEEVKSDDLDAEPTETVLPSSYTRSDIAEERDVDEYNRRFSGYEEENYPAEEETAQEPEKTQVTVEPERRSDLEYSERIIRYHSPI